MTDNPNRAFGRAPRTIAAQVSSRESTEGREAPATRARRAAAAHRLRVPRNVRLLRTSDAIPAATATPARRILRAPQARAASRRESARRSCPRRQMTRGSARAPTPAMSPHRRLRSQESRKCRSDSSFSRTHLKPTYRLCRPWRDNAARSDTRSREMMLSHPPPLMVRRS